MWERHIHLGMVMVAGVQHGRNHAIASPVARARVGASVLDGTDIVLGIIES
jgi:hypothetical protein